MPSTKPLSKTLCRAGGGVLSEEACRMSFADSGFIFDINNGIANLIENNVLIKAVRKNDASKQCVPAFANVTRKVAFWGDYITPDATARPVSWPISVNGTDAGLTTATAKNVDLAFNSQGQAKMAINYADAGRVQLNARYTGSVATEDSGLMMEGANQFVRRPDGLCLQTGGECSLADASCPGFRRAGENFTLKITARAWQKDSTDICTNPITPNFQQDAINLNHSLVAPISGVVGNLGTITYKHKQDIEAKAEVAQNVSEVGVFKFGSGEFKYLDMTESLVPAAISAAAGRFYPAYYALTADTVVPACSGRFSYFGQQGFSTSFSIQALNTYNNITQNYKDGFAKLNLNQWTDSTAGTGLRYSAPSLPAGSQLQMGEMLPVGNWSNGTANVISTHYATRPSALAAPLALHIYATPIDIDGVTTQTTTANVISSNPTELRFGRLVLDNAYGPEAMPLPISFYTEYWQGSQFVLNSDDSCSIIAGPPLGAVQDCPLSQGTADTCNTLPGNTPLSLVGVGGTINNGVFPANSLLIPATNNEGAWRLQYNAPPWLRYNWREGSSDFSQQPQADIQFGRFRGNPRQIYWRELF